METQINKPTLLCGDCMDLLHTIPDKSVDFIFCDLPFGTTRNDWDKPLPLEDYVECDGFRFTKAEYLLYAYSNGASYAEAQTYWETNKQTGLWTHYKRILKDRGCIALFCQTPFDMQLGSSNPKMLKYEWIIEKTKATGFLNANKAPLKAHEKILVFYQKLPTYNPQKTTGHTRKVSTATHKRNSKKTTNYGKSGLTTYDSTERYPRDVLTFKWDTQKSALHSTQKPIELLEYFLKTYTNPGDIVLDNCMGSGSTGVACLNTGRQFIGIEKDPQMFNVANERIERNYYEINTDNVTTP